MRLVAGCLQLDAAEAAALRLTEEHAAQHKQELRQQSEAASKKLRQVEEALEVARRSSSEDVQAVREQAAAEQVAVQGAVEGLRANVFQLTKQLAASQIGEQRGWQHVGNRDSVDVGGWSLMVDG